MTDTLIDPLPPLKPHERHPLLETDVFCLSCGYNLHSQPVWRDERLGIFVCRCPECGRFHPAGTGLTAASPWNSRLATALLVLWTLIILFSIFWIVMGLGAIAVAHTESFTYRRMETLDGQPAEYKEIPLASGGVTWMAVRTGTTQPAGDVRQVLSRNMTDADPRWNYPARTRQMWWLFGFLVLGAASMAFVTGLLLVVFLWHWKRSSYARVLLLPIVIATGLSALMAAQDENMYILPWAIRIAFGYALLEVFFMAVGIKLGRPIVRGLLRMFIPPKPRQHFAFLWLADGKSMPASAPEQV